MGTIFWKCSPSYLVQYFRYFWDLVSGTNYQITSKKIAKSPSPQLLKITKSPIFLGTNHQITNKKIAKSPSPQLFKITKSPTFSCTNHQITNKKIAKSPSPQVLKITKSPIFSCTNHQITNKKVAQSPITKNTSPPLYILCFGLCKLTTDFLLLLDILILWLSIWNGTGPIFHKQKVREW